MKTTTTNLTIAFFSLFISLQTAQSTPIIFAEYHLGESGSLAAPNNNPQDSSTNAIHFISHGGGSSATVGTAGVVAPLSTHYIDTTSGGAWFNALYDTAALPTDDFAFGIYARTSDISNDGYTYSLGNDSESFQVGLDSTGWTAGTVGGTQIGDAATFVADTWVHLAIIRSSGVSTFYVDNVQQGLTSLLTPIQSRGHLSIDPGGSNAFSGHLDEARIVTFSPGDSTASILGALQAVPEPSSLLLSLIGIGLALTSRKIRK